MSSTYLRGLGSFAFDESKGCSLSQTGSQRSCMDEKLYSSCKLNTSMSEPVKVTNPQMPTGQKPEHSPSVGFHDAPHAAPSLR